MRKKDSKKNGHLSQQKLTVDLHVYRILVSNQGRRWHFRQIQCCRTFTKKMLPDSLFNFITEGTNLRAKRHYASVITQNDKSWSDVR